MGGATSRALHQDRPQFVIESQRNLSNNEMRGILLSSKHKLSHAWDYVPAPFELVAQWKQRGAKKGDAVIAAHLEASNICYFVSENRHFLMELSKLPFTVLTRKEAVDLLG
jgi:hypothetical protein